MLPAPNIPTSTVLLSGFRTCFTAPGYRTFSSVVTGLVAQTRRRTVCGMLLGAELEHSWRHTRAHGFFSAARWCVDEAGLAMTPSWVIARIVVDLPFCSRPRCLPVLARLWRPRRTGKIAYARELAELIAARYRQCTVHVVGDAAYVGEHLRGLDPQITWTCRLKVTSVLYELPPPRT